MNHSMKIIGFLVGNLLLASGCKHAEQPEAAVQSVEVANSTDFSRYYFATDQGEICGTDCRAGGQKDDLKNCPAKQINLQKAREPLKTETELTAFEFLVKWINDPTMIRGSNPNDGGDLAKALGALDTAFQTSQIACGKSPTGGSSHLSEETVIAEFSGLKIGSRVSYSKELTIRGVKFRFPHGPGKLIALKKSNGIFLGTLEIKRGALKSDTQNLDVSLADLEPIIACKDKVPSLTESQQLPVAQIANLRPPLPNGVQSGIVRFCTKKMVCLMPIAATRAWTNFDEACDWYAL